MTILNGQANPSRIVEPLAARMYLSPNVLQVNDSTFDPNSPRLTDPSQAGILIHNPILPSKAVLQTEVLEGVNSHFYGRFQRLSGATRLDGTIVDLGIMREADVVNQTLWNGFNRFVKVTAIGYSYPTSDVTVTAPVIDEEFRYYEERPLEITVDIAGDPFFDVEITLYFDNGSTYVFSVRGTRRPQKEFTYLSQANWQGGLSIETQWLTSIYKASETSETRQALKVYPTRKMRYGFAAIGKDFSTVLWGFMQGLAKRRTYLPLFQDGAVVTQDSTGVRIYINTQYKRFFVGNTALLVLRRYDRSHKEGTATDEAMYYPVVINAVSSTYIDVLSSPVATIPRNSIVYPAMLSEIALKPNYFEAFKTTGAIADVTINEVYGEDTLEGANSSYTPTTYYGDAYLDIDLNWDVDPKLGIHRDAIVLKGGRQATIIPRTGFSTADIEVTISVDNRVDWWEMQGFLNYIKGRYKAFWIKHPMDVYRLGSYRKFDGGDVEEVEVFTSGGINNMYSCNAIWVKSTDGTENIIKVTGLRAGFTDKSVILELDPTTLSDIIELKRAFLVRSTSDKVKEQWFNDIGLVEVKLKCVELPGGYS